MEYNPNASLPQLESMVRNPDGTYRTTIVLPATVDLGPKVVAITVDLPAEHADPLTRHEAGMQIMLNIARKAVIAAEKELVAYIKTARP